MIAVVWRLSVAIHYFLRTYMPTNRAIAWLRTPRGLKWAIPVALIATPTYLFAMVLAVAIIDTGGPGWFHLVFLWAFWNAGKFTGMAILSLPLRALGALRQLSSQASAARR